MRCGGKQTERRSWHCDICTCSTCLLTIGLQSHVGGMQPSEPLARRKSPKHGARSQNRESLRFPMRIFTPCDIQLAPIRRKETAKTFLRDVSLLAYVEQQNSRGHAVSSRAVLERDGLLLGRVDQQAPSRLQPLSRRAHKWVIRWQRRHGLSRGRFRVGAGLTDSQKQFKAVRLYPMQILDSVRRL